MRLCLWRCLGVVALLANVVASESDAATLALAQEDSTFICLPGEAARVSLRVLSEEGKAGAVDLRWEVSYLDGEVVEKGTVSGEGVVSFEPEVSASGYYDFRCEGSIGEQEIAPFYGSIVRLSERTTRTEESRFGLYKHGNLDLVETLKPWKFYDYLTKSGAHWMTSDMWWNLVQPDGPDEWHWERLDQQFADAKANGLQLIPHLFGVPNWASSYDEGETAGGDGHKHAVYPPKEEAWEAWRAFVRAFVERYGDDLDYLRIWNEFDTAYWMGSYEDFAHLLRIAYEEAHSVKPDIAIVIDVALAKLSVFDALLQEGGGPYFDVLSIHNYQLNMLLPPEQTSLVSDYRATKAWRDKHFPDRQIWESEICWLAEPWSFPSWYGHGERAQAQYAARGQLLALMCGMDKVIWFPYHAWKWEENGKSYEHGGGLTRYDMTPRPAFASYATMTNLLQNAHFTRRLALGAETAYALEFANEDGTFVTALWSADTAPEQITLHSTDPELSVVTMVGRERKLLPRNGMVGLELTGSPIYVSSKAVLSSVESVGVAPGFEVRWSVGEAEGGAAALALNFRNLDAQADCLYAELEDVISPENGFPMRVNLFQGRDASGTANVLLPSRGEAGELQTHLRIWEEGAAPRRFPVRFSLPQSNQSEWIAPSAQTPVAYERVLKTLSNIEGVLVSFKADTAYDVALEGKTESGWEVLSPFALRSGVCWIPVGRELSGLRLQFRQMLHDASLEGPEALKPRGPGKEIPPNQWWAARNRDYIKLVDENPHSGLQCVEINAMDAGRGRTTNEFSQVEQVVAVKPNTYYTFSAYAKMPKTQDAWGAVFIVGETPEEVLLPHSFSVLPYVDDSWHRISLTVRTESYHDSLRMSCTPIANGLIYFDDMTAIEGMLPTDVPEIVSLDVYSESESGKLVRVTTSDNQ